MSQLNATLAGLAGAIAFGAGDFIGGCATLRLRRLAALSLVQVVALATGIGIFATVDGELPTGQLLGLAVLSGLFHFVGVLCLYQGFSIGRMTVVTPISAVIGLMVPVLADVLLLGGVKLGHGAGILLSFIAVALISQVPAANGERWRTRRAIRLGLVSGLGYGMADCCLGLMTPATAEGGLVIARSAGTALAVSVLFGGWCANVAARASLAYAQDLMRASHDNALLHVVQPSLPEGPRWLATPLRGQLLCCAAGICDCLGQLGFVLAATQGQISVAASLIALYPAITVVLGVWLLRESVRPTQVAGLLASCASLPLLAT